MEYDKTIFSVTNEITINEHGLSDVDAPICVLGVLNNSRGMDIYKSMLEWLEPHFKIFAVLSDGTLFEYPALRYAQWLTEQGRKYVLYLHTKGAFNKNTTNKAVLNMWRKELVENKEKYTSIVDTDEPAVACPLEGHCGTTWFNGFYANAAAFASIEKIIPKEDRYFFERLFKGSTIVHGVVKSNLKPIQACQEALKYFKPITERKYSNAYGRNVIIRRR